MITLTSLSQFVLSFIDPRLHIRVRLFNVLAIGGTLISLAIGGVGAAVKSGPLNLAVTFAVAALSFALLAYSRLTGRYQACYLLSITVIFLLAFPVLFFAVGGYESGMPSFFIFAVAFTIFMLEGKKALFFALGELILYVGCCALAYARPDAVRVQFSDELGRVLDVASAFTLVSLVLGASLYLHFKLYNDQKALLDRRNEILAKASQAKTEFLANSSHEMRAPLTVISVNVQTVAEILEDLGVRDPEVEELLQSAQSEIMRLARMVGGMLTLASMSESPDKEVLDLSSLLQSGAETFRLNLSQRGNVLLTEVEPGLKAFGSADLLAQVTANLLQNANAHTENGTISLRAARVGREIVVAVRDTGEGVSPELLPRVFERGVSAKGTGFGLYLCKTVVESHGGRVWLESELGGGATASLSLPAYEGQLGAARRRA
ncbi:MAG: HAMP domain-containing histidine kinase [Deltaproteobacteria bacterium]|jgi:signal transduction histidine kinase|nr:HAMP domain-containing histidine kinase [Deltaproteobacteria bacterium]